MINFILNIVSFLLILVLEIIVTIFAISWLLYDKIKKINWLDFIGAFLILFSLYYIKKYNIAWLSYSIGCFLWIIIMYLKKLYFGMIMNITGMIIGIINYLK